MTDPNTPWYREGYVWLVIGIPAAAVIIGVATLFIAAMSFDGVVEDDYYQRGLEINQDLRRDRRAEALGLTARIDLSDRGEIRIEVTGDDTMPAALFVRFLHATRSGVDRELVMPASGNGVYVAPVPDFVPGRWNVHIEGEDWRLRKSMHF